MASNKSDLQEQHNVLVGMGAGGAAAATAGAVLGAISGGPVGAIAGATLGGMIGSVSGGALAYGDVEPEFRRAYESSPTSARGSQQWDDLSPAYRYGWEAHDRPEYQGKAWSQVNSDLEKGWTGEGQWTDFEPHVRSAWERRAIRNQTPTEPAIPENVSKDHEMAQGAEPLASLLLGGTGGAILGGTMGLAVGGPIGMAVGATIGTVAGSMLTHDAVSDWHEKSFQGIHEGTMHPQGGHAWEQAKPAYRFGWEAHDHLEMQGKSWAEARPELQKEWKGPGSFGEYERYIKEGWERRLQPKLEPVVPDWA